jgi:hypothetical protein
MDKHPSYKWFKLDYEIKNLLKSLIEDIFWPKKIYMENMHT